MRMQKIGIGIGIIGLLIVAWLISQGISIDYVATVDDELAKLELELDALDTSDLSDDQALAATNGIATRISTINASLSASKERALNPAQQQMLDEGLVRLQRVLAEHEQTLVRLDQSSQASSTVTIDALGGTIETIKTYLNKPNLVLGDSTQNATYSIDGQLVTLVNGVATTIIAPDSAGQIVTTYFGNEVLVDLNNDGRQDAVFLVTQSTGGSGLFYYVVAALNTEAGWQGSAGFLLGDRIAPQTTELSQNPSHQNVVVVNYMDRNIDEPMTTEPSVGMSVWLKLDPADMDWGEVEQDFEGEADPSRMTLTMKPWMWVQTTYSDGTVIAPATTTESAFVLNFASDGSVGIATDCNSMGGSYSVKDNQITFSDMFATEMYCEGSQEQVFADMLNQVQSFFFSNQGELVFDLTFDSGSSVFR